MKAIIPAAGVGVRLRPITNTTPKALVQVGDKPIIGHIVAGLEVLGISEVIVIIGYLGELLKEYLTTEYPTLKTEFVYQKERLGLGHAVWICGDLVPPGEELFIIYGDTIVEDDLTQAFNLPGDGALGVKRVDDPSRFGVVELDGEQITRLVEKPDEYITDLALIGVNYIKDSKKLFDALDYIIENNIKTAGEIQITDAFQRMIEQGAELKTFTVENWFDCGEPETLLSTNRHIIERLDQTQERGDSVFIPPVYVAPDAVVICSIIGPNVTIARGSRVERCILSDTIVNPGAYLKGSNLRNSLVGIGAVVNEPARSLSLGDHTSIEGGL